MWEISCSDVGKSYQAGWQHWAMASYESESEMAATTSSDVLAETPRADDEVNVKTSIEPDTVNKTLSDLSTFKLDRILVSDSRSKTICAVGTFSDREGAAIIFLEKTPFDEDTFNGVCSGSTSLNQIIINDIYGTYQCFPEKGLNALKALVIHPATEKHIRKYEPQVVHFVDETPELYETVTLPHLKEEQFTLDWVYNCLEHKAEAERIVVEDDDDNVGFILAPDLKWDGLDLKSLYLLAIARPRNIKSLRDLTAAHLPLLENILKKGTEGIYEKYGVPASQLRIYVHYQPSFYHFHVHFTYLLYDAPGINCGRAHLLVNVINNIKLMSDYYKKSTLPFTVREGDRLFTKLCEKGVVKPLPKTEEKPAENESQSAKNGEQA